MGNINIVMRRVNRSKYEIKYTVDEAIKPYFLRGEAFVDFSDDMDDISSGVAIAPAIGTVMDVASALGVDIDVDIIEEDLLKTLIARQHIVKKLYPNFAGKTKINAKTVVKSKVMGTGNILLFSGGVDATTQYLRMKEKNPHLVMLSSKDVITGTSIKDIKDRLTRFLDNQKAAGTFVNTNLRGVLNYEELLRRFGKNFIFQSWWGAIQHSLFLTSLVIPVAFIKGCDKVYIASTYTKDFDKKYSWGSRPDLDQSVLCGGIGIVNENDLSRQDKLEVLVDRKNEWLGSLGGLLRTCNIRGDRNCCECFKCRQTIAGIIVAGGNPKEFGFELGPKIIEDIQNDIVKSNKESIAIRCIWEDIQKHIGNRQVIEEGKEFVEWFKGVKFEEEKHEIRIVDRVKGKEKIRVFRPMTQYIMKEMKKRPLVGVEIGTFSALNAYGILNKLGIRTLYLIDPYEDYPEYENQKGRSEKANFITHSEAELAARYRLRDFSDKTVFVKKRSNDAIADIPDGVDFIYIDGNHAYEFVKKDIETYYPKVRKGGVFGGHDYTEYWPGVPKAVNEFIKEKKLKLFHVKEDWWVIKS